jgi:lipid A 3-O-deacylase
MPSLRRMVSPVVAAFAFVCLTAWTPAAHAQVSLVVNDPAQLALGAGAFDAISGRDTAGLFDGEYRFGTKLFYLRPMVGVQVTTKGALYGYGGFGLDVAIGKHWILTPNAAVGAFERGDGTDLGSWVEFRTGAELDYHFADQSRLGVAFHHISNAGLTKQNPGEEQLTLVYSLPLSLVLP